jgi:ABC-type branched-subunit amino acid transport system ATPase component
LIQSELENVSFSGSVEYGNQRINKKLPEESVAMGIIHVLEGHKVLDDFASDENLLIGAVILY